jgi:hypothetical protein
MTSNKEHGYIGTNRKSQEIFFFYERIRVKFGEEVHRNPSHRRRRLCLWSAQIQEEEEVKEEEKTYLDGSAMAGAGSAMSVAESAMDVAGSVMAGELAHGHGAG